MGFKFMRNNCFPTAVSRLHERLIVAGTFLQPAVLLVVRLFWGVGIYMSGYAHITHIEDTYKNFVEWHIPLARFNVYVSGVTELVGGLLLLAGLFTRVTAVVVFFNFCVAILATSHAEITGLFTGPERWDHLRSIIDDIAFPFWTIALVLLAFGPGRFSVDRLLGRKYGRQDLQDVRLTRELIRITAFPPVLLAGKEERRP